MKKTFILSLTALILGLSLAQPALAANSNGTAKPTIFQTIGNYLSYQSVNAVNGVVINITSTNSNVVDKLHAKYDSLPKTSKKIANGQIEVDLIKTDNGIQILLTVLHPMGENFQTLVQKLHDEFSAPKHVANQIMKIKLFLMNHFAWAL